MGRGRKKNSMKAIQERISLENDIAEIDMLEESEMDPDETEELDLGNGWDRLEDYDDE